MELEDYYNSDNSIQILQRYIPSSSSSCDNARNHTHFSGENDETYQASQHNVPSGRTSSSIQGFYHENNVNGIEEIHVEKKTPM